MAETTLTVTLNDTTLERLRTKAQAMGLAPEILAARLIEQTMFELDRPYPSKGVQESERDFDSEEPGRPWSEVRPELEALIDRTFT